MTLNEFCENYDTTRSEEMELRWYLIYLRWRQAVMAMTQPVAAWDGSRQAELAVSGVCDAEHAKA